MMPISDDDVSYLVRYNSPATKREKINQYRIHVAKEGLRRSKHCILINIKAYVRGLFRVLQYFGVKEYL